MIIKTNRITALLVLFALTFILTSFSCCAEEDDDEWPSTESNTNSKIDDSDEEPEYFPLTKRLFQGGGSGGGGNDPAAALLSSVSITFSTVFDLILASTQLVSESSKAVNRSHKEKRQKHAAAWSNPNSMIAKSMRGH